MVFAIQVLPDFAGWILVSIHFTHLFKKLVSICAVYSIVGTIAGTAYFGPTPGHDETHHSLEMMRAKRRLENGDFATEVPGEVGAVPAGELADAYVKVTKKEEQDKE